MKLNQKGAIDMIVVGVLVVMLLVGGFVLLNSSDSDEVSENQSISPVYASDSSDASTSVTAIPEPGLIETVNIDYGECDEGSASIYYGFGHTEFLFEGLDDGVCVYWFGGEIENPSWDGELDSMCSVPATLGEQEFEVGDSGPKWSEFVDEYCTI